MAELRTGANIQNTVSEISQNPGGGLIRVPVESLEPHEALRVLQIQIFELTDHIKVLTDQVFALRQGRSR